MFYKILQEIMDEKGLSIAEVARISDLSDSTVRSIINRKTKTVALEVAFKLSKGLNVSLERLNGIIKDSSIDESVNEKLSRYHEDDFEKLLGLTKEQALTQDELCIDGKPVSKEDIASIFDAMSVALEIVKRKNMK